MSRDISQSLTTDRSDVKDREQIDQTSSVTYICLHANASSDPLLRSTAIKTLSCFSSFVGDAMQFTNTKLRQL